MIVKSLESRVESQAQAFALRLYSGSRLSTLDSRRARRAALTLIELLVVIIILTTVVAAAIPILSPANDSRRIREAGRGLNTFITGAQARAVSLGRPFGIALKRLAQDNDKDGNPLNAHDDAGVCLEVFYVEQQPPYAGFDANSRASVALHPDAPGYVLVRFITRGATSLALPAGWTRDLFPTGTIRPGDVIEVGGTRYELLPETGDNMTEIALDPDLNNGYFKEKNANVPIILARPVNDSGQQLNVKYDDDGFEVGVQVQQARPYWTSAMPYRILRQATPTSDEPYQLPEGVAIDLRASGVGTDDYFFWPGENDNSLGVIIMFTPEGRVSRVQFSQYPITPAIGGTEANAFDEPVTENIYLLLGKRENIPAPQAATDITLSTDFGTLNTEEKRAEAKAGINWLLGDSHWIVIGSQSGRVATIENAAVDPLAVINKYTPRNTTLYTQNSEAMRCAQILEAREFTREASQLGGR
jgi:type II secretory pathway pseudopilin PulG